MTEQEIRVKALEQAIRFLGDAILGKANLGANPISPETAVLIASRFVNFINVGR